MELKAAAGDCEDCSQICKMEKFNEAYQLMESADVLNWFEISEREGYYSINDKLGDIMASKHGVLYMGLVMAKLMAKMKRQARKSGKKGVEAAGMDIGSMDIKKVIMGMSVKRLTSMVGMLGPGMTFTKDQVLAMNRKLNKIHRR